MAEQETTPREALVERESNGRWKPGSVPNPGGKPPLPDWLRGDTDKLLKLQRLAAFEGVLPIRLNPDAPQGEEPKYGTVPVDTKHRMLAIESLLNRSLGRPSVAAGENHQQRDEVIDMLLEVARTQGVRPGVKK